MTTIIDLAHAANVSKTTISRYLNGEAKGHISATTQERIKIAIKELNYRPNEIARELKGTRTKCVGIIINDLMNPFFLPMLRGIESKLRAADYTMMVCNSDMDVIRETEILKMLDQKRVEGIIIIGLNMPAEHVSRLNIQAPIVLFERDEEEYRYDSLKIDNKKGVNLAVKHLVKKGYRRIAHIKGTNNAISNERAATFIKCMEQNNMFVRDEFIVSGDYKMEKAYWATARLFELNTKPDAIFCSNDMMAFGAMRYLLEHHYKIPEDVAIIGYDDIDMAKVVTPALTTVRQPVLQLAQTGTDILLKRILKEKLPGRQDIALEPELIIRQSS
jgi:LacI family transcriptional regulator